MSERIILTDLDKQMQEAVADNSRAILVVTEAALLVMDSKAMEVSQEAVRVLLVNQVRTKNRIPVLKKTVRTSSLTRSVRAMTGLLRT